MATTTRKTTARSSSRGAAAVKGRARAQAAEAEEFVEVTGGGDFPPVWDFEEQGDLVGTFVGTDEIQAKGQARTIHTFEVDDQAYNVWGAAILNSRLEDVAPGSRVKIIKTGDKIPTKNGKGAWEFKVLVAKGALARR